MRVLLILTMIALVPSSNLAAEADLKITIRPHARQITFGDPVYLEVTIVNQGKEAADFPRPHLDVGTLKFKIYDPESDLEINCGEGGGGFIGEGEPMRFEPGKPVKQYWYVFLPGLNRFKHQFWKRARNGHEFYVWGVYRIGDGLELHSKRKPVRVNPRDEEELKILESLTARGDGTYDKGPDLGSFGVQLRESVSRQRTLDISSKIKSGEMLDLFLLTIRMQEIYAAPRDSREASDRGLVELLKKFPDVKRQALTNQARSIAEAYNMRSTVKGLESLDEPE